MEATEIRLESVPRLVNDIWGSMLGLELAGPAAPAETGAPPDSYTAWLRIIGSENITIILKCPESLAQKATAAMFDTRLEEVSPDQVKDSLKEIVNILGGNVKGMLTKYHFLSMPSVAEPGRNPYFPMDEMIGEFKFTSLGQDFQLTLLKVD
jgi:chemotaxis protein CheX